MKYDPNYNPITRPYIYITAHGGGVWKSTDCGSTFNPMGPGLPTQASGAVCIDPNNPDVIYYATGGSVESGINYYGLGVFKSTNGGIHWTGGYNVGLPPLTFSYKILVNPDANHSNWVYLAEQTGLYISQDAGVTWNRVPIGPTGNSSCSDVVTSTDGSKVYAIGGWSSMYRPSPHAGIGYWISLNYGANFSQGNFDMSGKSRTQIAISKTDNRYVYIVTRASGRIHAYVSTDGVRLFRTIKIWTAITI